MFFAFEAPNLKAISMSNVSNIKAHNVFAEHFENVTDPRTECLNDHLLLDIIGMSVCAVICGADGFTGIETFGKEKEDWLGRFLTLKNGVPSHDTIGDVLARLDPDEFEESFRNWIATIFEKTEGEIVAIDGKTLRRSYDSASNKAALHMVSAWASANNLTLGQVKTSGKSNEITAIPKLLKVLDVSGCLVTIDAMGCQKEIADLIADQGADYVLALKGNQGELYADTKALFDRFDRLGSVPKNQHESVTGGHGRVETRRCVAVDIAGRGLLETEGWSGLRTVCRVEAERWKEGQTTTETRYFVSSLRADAERLLEATQTHWHIENKLHWVLDVAFEEDESRIREGHASQNMATIRRLARSLLENETTSTVGVKNKRLQAAWSEEYLLKVLTS